MGILGKEGGVEESVGGLGNRLFLKSSLAAPSSKSAPGGFWLGMWHGGKMEEKERGIREMIKMGLFQEAQRPKFHDQPAGEAEIRTQICLTLRLAHLQLPEAI